MEWVETTGRTIAEALDAALDELGVDEDDVEYEVLEQPKSGFLGRLGSSEGRIRARVKPISREKPGERQRRKGRGTSRPGGGGGGGGGGNGARRGRREDARAGASNRSRRRVAGMAAAATAAAGQSGSGTCDATTSSRGAPWKPPNVKYRSRSRPKPPRSSPRVWSTPSISAPSAKSVIDDDVVVVEVTGDNLGLLVGPKGATLHAIEELVRTVVQRQTDGHGVRIHVDVAGYRAKRREALADFTRNLAEKVLETGRPQALEPMSASDRKVVHDTAAEIDGIATASEGEDPRRRVVLRPA